MPSHLKTLFVLICLYQAIQTKDQFQQYTNTSGDAQRITITPNNRVIAGLANNEVTVYDKQFTVIKSIPQLSQAEMITYGNNILAITAPGEPVMLFDTNSWGNIWNSSDSWYLQFPVDGLAISKEGRWMAVGSGYYVDIYTGAASQWDMADLFDQDEYAYITSVGFSNDEKYLFSASSKSVMILQEVASQYQPWQAIKILPTNNEGDVFCAFSDDYLACALGSEEVKIYSIDDFTEVKTITITGAKTNSVSFLKNKYLAVGTKAQGVKLYNVGGNWGIQQELEQDKAVRDVAFSDDHLAIAFVDGSTPTLALYELGSVQSSSRMLVSVILFVILSLLYV